LARDHPSALSSIIELLEWCLTSGNVDALICGMRGSALLTTAFANERTLNQKLRPVLERAGDDPLLRALGLSSSAGRVALSRSGLTPRELEVLGLVHQGYRNQDIAKALFVSPVTVKVHLRHIYEKLGVRGRTEAAVKAAAFLGDATENDD
jgi:ATP/maltotriose-dependent transcriptional regulator MalT